ncbi:MAG: hypothetical protein AAGB15_00605 [Pseudomonadota bacterium]
MNVVPDYATLLDARAEVLFPETQDVSRRKVFYVSGFDPLGPRRYRELYRKEGPQQGGISGYDLKIKGLPRTECGNFRWQATYERDDVKSTSEFEFLGWDDIVRHSIRPSLSYVYTLMFRTFWIYFSSGAIRAMWRMRSGPLVAGLVPAAMMIFYLVYAGLIGTAAGMVLAGPAALPWWAAAMGGAGAAILAMLGTRYFEQQMMIYFMVNDLGYSAKDWGSYPKPLSDRLDVFAERIQAALASGDYDEVLVVGHSSGAQLAVTALARCIRKYGFATNSHVGLLTLGQSIAMTSFLPKADDLRADLAFLADDARVFWLDVTAPGDGACFALSDPAATCRAAGRPDDALNPLVMSAAFNQTMAPGEVRRYRWRLLRLHFQYLCAFARPGDFDYFRITAGPRSLGARFAGRECSPSMLARPISPVCHPA